jgi:hypothetical protein
MGWDAPAAGSELDYRDTEVLERIGVQRCGLSITARRGGVPGTPEPPLAGTPPGPKERGAWNVERGEPARGRDHRATDVLDP